MTQSSGGASPGGDQPTVALAVPIEEQIVTVERELGFRRRLYPRWVGANKLTQAAADTEIRRMEAVLLTLQRVQRNLDHLVPDAATIRRGAEARVLCMVAPFLHSSKVVEIERKLRGES